MSIIERNNKYITSCLKNEMGFRKIANKNDSILEGRNQNFIKLRKENEK